MSQSVLRMPALVRGEPVDALQAQRHGQTIITDGDLSWLATPGDRHQRKRAVCLGFRKLLAEQSGSYGLIWQLSGVGEIKASLRSKGKTLDVATIASRYGGGGHTNASGFQMPAQQFFSEVLNLSPKA
ncbi:MAG: hypothetical protein IPJ12_12475 [Betaproteobacteria bacterium]|nr:hypothetical protein [Betaproteobacteria bacterium]